MRVFNIDITRKGISPVVQVTEYDAMSRFFTLVLRDGAADYEEPEGATYSVWYKTKDSHGWYDTITEPDEGTHPAVVADGNAYTIEIAEQATTSCGELALMINGDDGYQLTVSGIITRSDDIPGYDGEEVENYYNVYITEMRENAARAENAADIAVAYGATVEVDEDAQQLNITHHSDTEGGVGWLFGSAVTSSAEGSVAAFADGANDVAVKSLTATITPVQSGSGDPSPTNIRPISGRTGMTVDASAINIWDEQTTVGGYYDSTGAWRTDSSILGCANAIPVRPGMQLYCYSANGAAVYVSLFGRMVTIGTSATDAFISRTRRENQSFTIPDGAECLYFNFASTYGTTYQNDVSINYPATVQGMSPTARLVPIDWQTQAGTVYGGTLDVVSGVLTVDKIFRQCDADSNFGKSNSTSIDEFFLRNSSGEEGISGMPYGAENIICSHAASFLALSTTEVCTRLGGGGQARICFPLSMNINTLALFKTWLGEQATAGTPLQFCYKLATPHTYQLTPTEVRTILGGNTIYTDAGAVSVEYVADTKLYIDNKVAELQALILEN